ncbi:MAG: putative serine/threonine protein kinase [Gemmatimonadetes bacterium]|nr:putative serine/threonine protein kinase [Gemmatimonadota bacterium]
MPKENLIGRSLAGYTLRGEVGEGGTSAVFRAEHATHGTVAVKVLREKLRQDKTAVARFVREARYGERVQHPNVVQTIEVGEAGPGMHFLAIEWAAGELLERYAKQRGPLPQDEVATIIRQIGDAVHAAHVVGIVHRDLKPDNVMYDPTSRQVKLLDFGIATDTDMAPEQRLTRAGFFVGTLMYVAPEALSGELVSPAADQYSLATIAYLLLTGCLPFTAKTPREMFSQLLSQPPIPLNAARPNLKFSSAVEQVIMRGLSKDPRQRYPDTVTFARELDTALNAPEEAASQGLLSRVKGIFKR